MTTKMSRHGRSLTALAASSALLAAPAQAQPNIKPPQAQAWIDVATVSGMGMPTGGAAGEEQRTTSATASPAAQGVGST